MRDIDKLSVLIISDVMSKCNSSATAMEGIMEDLNDSEIEVFKRGRIMLRAAEIEMVHTYHRLKIIPPAGENSVIFCPGIIHRGFGIAQRIFCRSKRNNAIIQSRCKPRKIIIFYV